MSTAPEHGELVQAHLLELPVPLAARAQEHWQELLREFTLISSDASEHGAESGQHVPARLLELVDVLTQQFGGMNTAAEDRLEAAIATGQRVVHDHVLEVPPAAGPAAQALGAMIDEAEEYCRRGQHLLTLAASPELVAYRRWYLEQVVDQLEGKPPVPWPQYDAATT